MINQGKRKKIMPELVATSNKNAKIENGKKYLKCSHCTSWVLKKNVNKHLKKCKLKTKG